MEKREYIIFSDLSVDLAPSFAQKHDIRLIPMNYTIGEEERICRNIEQEAVLKRFYEAQRRGEATQTTQISPDKYIEVFAPLLQEGKAILYLSLSSGLSSTYQSSVIAAKALAEQYPGTEVVCVDSLAATGGMGLLLEAAAQNRDNGMSLRENAAWLEQNRLRVCHWFMVEDLMYLKRGGRIPASTAIVGPAFNIKPILKIENDGTLETFEKKRGVKAALKELVDLYAASSEGGEGERVYILHADSDVNADYLEIAVKAVNPKCSIERRMLSPVIGAHTGPGMCAIAHFGKRNGGQK